MRKRQSISLLAITLLISLLGVSQSEADESLSWEAETAAGSSIFVPGSADNWATEVSDISVPQGSGKLCRSLQVNLVSRNNLGVEIRRYSFNPTFIWSLNNNVLITAIPSSSSAC